MIRHDAEDASVTRMLADLAPFQRWENRPLPRQVRQFLHELDEQTRMSLAAHVLRQLVAAFRALSLAGLTFFWLVLGIGFGLLAERLQPDQRARGIQPRPVS